MVCRLVLKKSISLEIFNLAWKFQTSLEIFNPDLQNSPTKIGIWWVARLKFSISLENFKILKVFKIWALRVWGPRHANRKRRGSIREPANRSAPIGPSKGRKRGRKRGYKGKCSPLSCSECTQRRPIRMVKRAQWEYRSLHASSLGLRYHPPSSQGRGRSLQSSLRYSLQWGANRCWTAWSSPGARMQCFCLQLEASCLQWSFFAIPRRRWYCFSNGFWSRPILRPRKHYI